MKVSFFVAKRYFWAKKSRQLIQLISWISLVSVMICTASLFIVLSVFNGLQQFVTDRFNGFHADLEITVEEGKDFVPTMRQLEDLRRIPGVEYLSEVYTDMAVLVYEDRQYISHLKGVSPDYAKLKHIDTTVCSGDFLLEFGDSYWAVLGKGVEYKLQCPISDFTTNSLGVYYPKRGASLSSVNPMQSLNMENITPSGTFFSSTDYDEDYVFVPISFMRKLTGHDSEVTSLELKLSPQFPLRQVRTKVAEVMGDGFVLKDAFQQESELYKAMRTEKWAIFAILSFILLIASFNMIGMMALLVLDKRKDVGVFYAMGADMPLIRKIFVTEGLLISGIGTLLGLVLGYLFCWLQQTFHLIHFGEGYAISYYPVLIRGWDVLSIFLIVMLITVPAVIFPVTRFSEQLFRERMLNE